VYTSPALRRPAGAAVAALPRCGTTRRNGEGGVLQPVRLALLLTTLALPGASPAAAQIGIGGHYVQAGDAFDGTSGVGARLTAGLPLFPVSVALNGEYFFPDCGDADCSLYGATLDLNYALPLPLLQPWVGVGWSVRRVEVDDASHTERGFNVGVGAQLRLAAFRPFVDVRYELADAPEKQYLLRVGVMIR
jgi:opacity protein-like surface antigen